MIVCDHCEGTGAEADYTPTSEELILEILPRACEVCGGTGTIGMWTMTDRTESNKSA